MGFNYAKERRNFEAGWNKLREKYRDANMTEETIQIMYEFDLDDFRKCRTQERHDQPLPIEDFGEDKTENRTSLFSKFSSLTVSFDESDFAGRYAWVDEINNTTLIYRLKRLNQNDLELLTLFAIEGYSQTEIARLQGCSQQNISLKITRIINFLK